jgi:precorrin-6Y C5,15-methyltransferase (decarboxylating)
MHAEAAPWLTIVGIGEDGVDGLTPQARAALERAERIVGSRRIVELLPLALGARAQAWPSPMVPYLDELLARERGRPLTVVASGDPMFFGVGGSIARRLDAREFAVFAQPSCVSLACARLGWPQEEIATVSLVHRPIEPLLHQLIAGRRLIVLSEDGATPATVAAALSATDFGATEMHAFEALGGPRERRIDGVARTWPHARIGDLNLIALTVTAEWRQDYNTNHPHSSLGDLTPEEFAKRAKKITQKKPSLLERPRTKNWG